MSLVNRTMSDKKTKQELQDHTTVFRGFFFLIIQLDAEAGPILADVRVCVARVRLQ